MSLGGAAWALMHRGVDGAPVRDEEGQLVGVLSSAELLEARAGDPTIEADFASDERHVADVMTPAFLAVGPQASVSEVVSLMMAHDANRVMVLDDAGQLLGVVTARDLLREMAAGRLGPSRDVGLPATPVAPA
jgi:CBS domain-containing protein